MTRHDPHATLVDETPTACPEDGCTGTLRRRWSGKFERWFYGCDTWRDTKCSGGHGCHPNGAMLGVPADGYTKRLRKRVHEVLDVWWQERHRSRGETYARLASAMGRDRIHVGALSSEECTRAIEIIGRWET